MPSDPVGLIGSGLALLLEPGHAAALIVLILFGAQQTGADRAAAPSEWHGLGSGLAAGALLAIALGDPDMSRPLWLLTLVMATAVAADQPRPAAVRVAVGAGCGLLIGIGSGEPGADGWTRGLPLLGAGLIGLPLVAGLVLALARLLKHRPHPALRIGVRVAGSWIGACALLMLALALRQAR